MIIISTGHMVEKIKTCDEMSVFCIKMIVLVGLDNFIDKKRQRKLKFSTLRLGPHLQRSKKLNPICISGS